MKPYDELPLCFNPLSWLSRSVSVPLSSLISDLPTLISTLQTWIILSELQTQLSFYLQNSQPLFSLLPSPRMLCSVSLCDCLLLILLSLFLSYTHTNTHTHFHIFLMGPNHSFSKRLLNAHWMSGTVLGPENPKQKKEDLAPALTRLATDCNRHVTDNYGPVW